MKLNIFYTLLSFSFLVFSCSAKPFLDCGKIDKSVADYKCAAFLVEKHLLVKSFDAMPVELQTKKQRKTYPYVKIFITEGQHTIKVYNSLTNDYINLIISVEAGKSYILNYQNENNTGRYSLQEIKNL